MRRISMLLASCALTLVAAGATSALAAAPSPAQANRTLDGDKVCTTCHNEGWRKPILGLYHTSMGRKGDPRTPGCQSCHGPSGRHLENPGNSPDVVFGTRSAKVSPVETRNAVCLDCHGGGKRVLWAGSQHESHDVACVNCHEVHVRGDDRVLVKGQQRDVCFGCHQTVRAETFKFSTHPIQAGKVGCSDCHNPHGSEGPKLVAEKSVRDTCFTCHAEKRGPFLFEHPPVSDDCMNCHTPHGSTTPPLLQVRMPWLCQQCHGDSPPHPGNVYSGASLPGGRAVTNANTGNPILVGTINPITGQSVALNASPAQLAFRSCTNCHSQIHGSNHPAGQRFTR